MHADIDGMVRHGTRDGRKKGMINKLTDKYSAVKTARFRCDVAF